jgi:methionine sulfoxide reductase heme-binding subunit
MQLKRLAKPVIFIASLSPVFWATYRAFTTGLTANPVEYITHLTGDWTIRFLLITLAITPARKLFHLPDLIRYRRMLGLFAFFYGFLHFTTYFALDKLFMLADMLHDVSRRPFITVGFLGLVLMMPLAVTSTAGWIRRLGGRNWQRLHRLVYISAAAGVVHYYWLVKSDIRLPVLYGVLLGILLLARLAPAAKKAANPLSPVTAGSQVGDRTPQKS